MSASHPDNPQCDMAARGRGFLVFTLVLFFSTLCHAQEEQAPIYGAKQKRQWLTLDPIQGMIELDGLRTQNEINDANSHVKDTENLFTETLTLQTHGAIIHPNIVELNISGTFGLRQRDFKEDNNGVNHSESDNGTVTGYDLNAVFLRREKASLTLYAQRYEDTVNRDFGPSFINTTSNFGAIVDLRLEKFPTRIQAYHSEQNLEDPAKIQGYKQDQNTILWHTEWIHSDRSRLNFDYTYNNVHEKAELAPPVNFDINELSLSHTATFGADLKNNLTSSLDYLDQSGDFAEQRLHLSEQLTLQHSPVLQTYYRYSYIQDTRDTFDQDNHQGEIGFEHKLYQSLVTRGAVGFQIIDTTGVDQSQEGYARLDFHYTKKVPLGVLGLTLGSSYDHRNNDSQAAAVEVLDEPHTFSDPVGIVLVRTNIDAKSVQLTDASRVRIYQKGIDYTVQTAPNRIMIQRLLGGAINDSQAVLLDYTLLPQPGNTQDTISFVLGGRYDIDQGFLKGLSVYSRYFYQEQNINSDVPSAFIPDNVRDLTIGAEYKIGGLTLTAEQQWHDSSLAPYNSTRFGATYTRRLADAMILSLGATYSMIDYTDINEQLTYLNLSSSIDYQITRELHALASVTYRDQTDTLFGNTRGFEQQLQIQWRHRQTYIYAMIRNANLNNQGQDSSFQVFQIGIQRRF